MIIRFALVHSDNGKVETGANYPACSPSNPEACDPQSFENIGDAQTYARSKGEQIYVVGSALPNSAEWTTLANQVWKYVSNPSLVPPAPAAEGSDLLLLGGVALVAYLLL